MTDQIPDDIFALYSRFDLDERNYRVFLRPEPRVAPADSPTKEKGTDAKSELALDAITDFALPTQGPKSGPTALESGNPQRVVLSDLDETRIGLENLWRRVHPVSEPRPANSFAAHLSAGSVSISGMAGGVGATTVSASLASLFARAGRRCAIIDGSEESTLPIFFRTQKMPDDRSRFLGLQSLFEPRIRIISSASFASELPSLTSASGLVDVSLVEQHLQFDHLIFDGHPKQPPKSEATLQIYVALPDVSSLIRARKKVKLDSRDQTTTVCVLNRFNSEIALHQEILAWYKANFRQVVTVLDSPLVSEALAEGTTVMDWAPESNVSADFQHLFRVVFQLIAEEERVLACS